MVDFGNETTVQCDKIRKFPAKLQNIPILGIACDFKSKFKFYIFQNINLYKKIVSEYKQIWIPDKCYFLTVYKWVKHA